MENNRSNHSRREALLWLARMLAALGLTWLGFKIGLNSQGNSHGNVPDKNQTTCQNCIFAKSTCIPRTPTCRKDKG